MLITLTKDSIARFTIPVVSIVTECPLKQKRRAQIAASMRRLRAKRRLAGLNNRGKPKQPNIGRHKKLKP